MLSDLQLEKKIIDVLGVKRFVLIHTSRGNDVSRRTRPFDPSRRELFG